MKYGNIPLRACPKWGKENWKYIYIDVRFRAGGTYHHGGLSVARQVKAGGGGGGGGSVAMVGERGGGGGGMRLLSRQEKYL